MPIKKHDVDPALWNEITNGELHVLVCSHKKTPRMVYPLTEANCNLCHRTVYMDTGNVEKAKEMALVCLPCYIERLAPLADEHRAMIGGQEMTIEEGYKTVDAMMKADDPSKAN